MRVTKNVIVYFLEDQQVYDHILEPVLAEVVRPVAEKIAANQDTSNLQSHNKRFDSLNQMQSALEQLKPRGKTPLPAAIDNLDKKPLEPLPIPAPISVTTIRQVEKKIEALGVFNPDNIGSDLQSILARYNEELKNQQQKEMIMNLPVKQMSQLDSETEKAHSMCASSVMAQLIHFLTPGLISPEEVKHAGWSQLDDYYLKELVEKQGGASTDPEFHVKVLTQLGFRAILRKDGDFGKIDRLLQDGIPVPMTFAHHGHVSTPDLSRYHWILCRGRVDGSKRHIYNDPYGEANLVAGGYTGNRDGSSMSYSDENLGKRWMLEGVGSGWFIEISRPFPVAKKPTPKPEPKKPAVTKPAPPKK